MEVNLLNKEQIDSGYKVHRKIKLYGPFLASFVKFILLYASLFYIKSYLYRC